MSRERGIAGRVSAIVGQHARRSARRWVAAVMIGGLAVVGLPAGAAAAPTWLPVVTLSDAGQDAQTPQVAVDANGDAIAVWVPSRGTEPLGAQVARRPAGAAWTSPVTLSQLPAYDLHVATDAKGDAVAVWESHPHASYRVQAVRRPAGGAWTSPVMLSAAGENARDAQVAVDARGDAVVVWDRFDGAHWRVQATRRPLAGPWSRPVTLSAAGQDGRFPQVAVDAKGDALVVWGRLDGAHSRILAASRRPGGAWTSPVTLSGSEHAVGDPQAAMDAKGDVVVVWGRLDRAAGLEQAQAVRRPVGGAWTSPVTLSGPEDAVGAPQVAVDRNGDAVVVWTARGGVHSARRPAGGAWTSPVKLSKREFRASTPQVAMDAKGDAVAVWQRWDGVNYRVQATRRPAGGPWANSVTLSAAGGDAGYPDVAMDVQGNAVAVWTRSDGTNTRAQARGLDAAGPVSRLTRPAVKQQTGLRFTAAWSARDTWSAVASYDVRVRSARVNGGFGHRNDWKSHTKATHARFTGRPGRTYCLEARARDTVGNLGRWSTARCTAIPLDDRALNQHGGWARKRGMGYFRDTYSVDRTHGATLTLAGAHVRDLALLASTGPGYGTVQVDLGSSRLGTLHLARAEDHKRVVVNVKTFVRLHTGTVTIWIVSHGKPVRIDGLFVSRVR